MGRERRTGKEESQLPTCLLALTERAENPAGLLWPLWWFLPELSSARLLVKAFPSKSNNVLSPFSQRVPEQSSAPGGHI